MTVSDSLFHEEFVDGLLFPHKHDNKSIQVDKQSPSKTTGNTAETERETQTNIRNRKHRFLLRVFFIFANNAPWVSENNARSN